MAGVLFNRLITHCRKMIKFKYTFTKVRYISKLSLFTGVCLFVGLYFRFGSKNHECKFIEMLQNTNTNVNIIDPDCLSLHRNFTCV